MVYDFDLQRGNFPMLDGFYVVTMISNPVRFSSRYRLYNDFRDRMALAGVPLVTAEIAFGDRPFEVTTAGNPRAVQLRTRHELWYKENAINIAISRLPADWRYVAWVDADIDFVRPDWAEETVHQLQHHPVVQMFDSAIDLGPNMETLQLHTGFGASYVRGRPRGRNYAHWHPGYAWAARREAVDAIGGLIDWALLGSADHHMAVGLIGGLGDDYITPKSKLSPRYQYKLQVWQDRAVAALQRDLGYVPGTILHYWHGKKRDRRYGDRWQILTRNQFDPDRHMHRDWQGLWQLSDGFPRLRDEIRGYFRARNEDSIDLE
jgi:hypothetical protein